MNKYPAKAVKKTNQPVDAKATAGFSLQASTNDVVEDGDFHDIESRRSPNDDRSDSMNPNNPAIRAAANNRSNQMNPNNQAYRSSRGGSKGKK